MRRRILLGGDDGARTVAALWEEDGALCYDCPPQAGQRLLLFASPERWFSLPAGRGRTRALSLGQVWGAALARGRELVCWGSAQAADWQVIRARVAASGELPPAAEEGEPLFALLPQARWRRVCGALPGSDYLTGEVPRGGEPYCAALAVPGHYALTPPPWLAGFEDFLQAEDGSGYWVAFTRLRGGGSVPLRELL